MKFTKTELTGAWIIEIEPKEDERGFFSRTVCKKEFEQFGLACDFVQCNISQNHRAGTIRGMHYQLEPFGEIKLISCIRGAIYDVIVDLRDTSSTFGKWIGVELTAHNHRALYIPKNFAHGYQTLQDDTEVFYQVSQFYNPGSAAGFMWNDPVLNIAWRDIPPILSEQDKNWIKFSINEENNNG